MTTRICGQSRRYSPRPHLPPAPGRGIRRNCPASVPRLPAPGGSSLPRLYPIMRYHTTFLRRPQGFFPGTAPKIMLAFSSLLWYYTTLYLSGRSGDGRLTVVPWGAGDGERMRDDRENNGEKEPETGLRDPFQGTGETSGRTETGMRRRFQRGRADGCKPPAAFRLFAREPLWRHSRTPAVIRGTSARTAVGGREFGWYRERTVLPSQAGAGGFFLSPY